MWELAEYPGQKLIHSWHKTSVKHNS